MYKNITQEKLKILHAATATTLISTLKYMVLVRLPPQISRLHLMLILIVRNYKLGWWIDLQWCNAHTKFRENRSIVEELKWRVRCQEFADVLYGTRTYLLTPRCRVLLEELTGLQLVKKFPAFHGTRRFITALTSVRHLSLSWASPIQSTSHLLEIHPNIIHPSTPRSPQWSLSLQFPHQDPIQPPSPHPYAPHAQPISFFSILSPAQYWVRSTDHLAPRYAVFSIPPLPRPSWVQIFSSVPCSQTLGFTTSLKGARHLSLSKARSIQFMPPCPTSWRFISILSSFTLESRVHITSRAVRPVWLNVNFIYEICDSRSGEYEELKCFVTRRRVILCTFRVST